MLTSIRALQAFKAFFDANYERFRGKILEEDFNQFLAERNYVVDVTQKTFLMDALNEDCWFKGSYSIFHG